MQKILKKCHICSDINVVKRSKKLEWYCKDHLDYMEGECEKEEIKRVPLSAHQYWRAYRKAASKEMKITEYLNDLVNKDYEINEGTNAKY